jgi:pantothenate synthetase
MLIEKKDMRDAAVLRRAITEQIERESKGRIDYVEIVSLQTLEPLPQVARDNTLIALACYWGSTRLIDNIRV